MPTIALSIPQHDATVTRTIVRQMGADFIQRFGLPADTQVLVEERIGQVANPEGVLDDRDTKPLSTDNYLLLRYSEAFTENGILQSAVYRPEFPSLFFDPDIGIEMRPTYGWVRMELAVEVNFRDKSVIQALQRKLRIRGGLMHHVQVHDLKYQYEIPDPFLAFLYDAWSLREAYQGYGENLADYFARAFIHGGLVKRSNLSGTASTLAINESQDNIIGRFNEEVFYNEIEQDGGRHRLSLEYNFEYQQPLAVVLTYPLFIHNQRIPQSYIDAWQPILRVDADGEATRSYMRGPDSGAISRYYRADGGSRLDPIDDWFPRNPQQATVTEVLTPILVDETDPTLIASLHDFTDDMVHPCIKAYLLAYPELVTEPYETPYLIQVYRVHRSEEQLTIYIESDGTIRSKLPMNPRHRHYLRIAKMVDLARIATNHVLEMLNNPERTLCVFKLLDSRVTLDEGKEWLQTVAGKYILDYTFRRSVKKIASTNRPYARLVETGPRYIQHGVTSTHRGKS